MTTQPNRRRRTLIKPRLQLWMTGVFVGLSALALLLQFALFTNIVHGIAVGLPNDREVMMEEFAGQMFLVLGASAFVFLPLTFFVGVLMTFRVAGPVYRFEAFLRDVIDGKDAPDFELRRKDQLVELAVLINKATEPLRRAETEGAAESNSEATSEASDDLKQAA